MQAALQRGTKLAACVSEAVRLQAPGMDIRIAAQDLHLPASSGRRHRVCKVAHICNLPRQGSIVLLLASISILDFLWPSPKKLHLLCKDGFATHHEILGVFGMHFAATLDKFSDLMVQQTVVPHHLWTYSLQSGSEAELAKESSNRKVSPYQMPCCGP